MKNNNTVYVQFEKQLYSLGISFYSNYQILTLGEFLIDCFDFEEILSLLKNHPEIHSYEGNAATAKIKENIVIFGILYEANNPEYEFTLSKETFINLLQDWIEIKKQNPKLVTLYWEDGTYRFETEE